MTPPLLSVIAFFNLSEAPLRLGLRAPLRFFVSTWVRIVWFGRWNGSIGFPVLGVLLLLGLVFHHQQEGGLQ
jgi:hypothetical protein